MAARGREILEGVGGDILNPRDGGGAYDDMLRALHDVVGAHDPVSNHTDRAMFVNDYYRHLRLSVDGAESGDFADLFRLTWPRRDYDVRGGRFYQARVIGANPLYELEIDVLNGLARVIDHELGEDMRRVGQRTLLSMTRGVNWTDSENTPDERYLSNGYVIIPQVDTIRIGERGELVTGDSVRRALEPYEGNLEAIAIDLAHEARLSARER